MIYIGLGANLPSEYGGPENAIYRAYQELESHDLEIIKASNIWASAPVPFDKNQPWYKNSVVAVSTTKTPLRLMKILLDIESKMGRVRTVRNAPRIIDLDLLCYDSLCCNVPGLTLPHPRMHERGFVLYPLREIAPNWCHPQDHTPIDTLISKLPADQQAFIDTPNKGAQQTKNG